MSTVTITLPAAERDVLDILDRMPAHIPLHTEAVHYRLTGHSGGPRDRAITGSLLDSLAVNGLATRTSGYLGTPGRFYAVTDRGHTVLHS